MKIQQLRELSRARKLPHSCQLGSIDQQTIAHILSTQDKCCETDELQENLQRRRKGNIPTYEDLNSIEQYRQISLQTLVQGGNPHNKNDYRIAVDQNPITAIEAVVGRICRARTTTLESAACLPEHIDDPMQRRIICLLSGRDEFTITTDRETVELQMEIGAVWFVNTSWPHKVVNLGKSRRVAIIANVVETQEFENRLKLAGANSVHY